MLIAERFNRSQTSPANRQKTAVNGRYRLLDARGIAGVDFRVFLLLAVFWTLFAGAEVAKDWYAISSTGWAFSLSRHAAHAAFIFIPWFVFSVGLGALLRRKPGAVAIWRSYVLHGVLAITVGLVHLLIVAASYWLFEFRGSMAVGFAAAYVELIFSWLHYEVLVYLAMLFFWRALIDADRSNLVAAHTSPRLVGRFDDETLIVSSEQVSCIASAEGAVVAYANNKAIRIRESLQQLSERLKAYDFVRVHRSAIININRLRSIDGNTAILTTGKRIKCSRAGKRALRQALLPDPRK